MTTIDCPESTVRQPLALTLAAGIVAKVAGLFRALRNRREFYHLGQMSDLELADIGLRRGDLYAVTSETMAIDPTGRLGAIAAGRTQEDFARQIN